MEDHSKREGPEIFRLHKKSVFYFIFPLKLVTSLSNISYFKKNGHLACHVTFGN